MSGSNLVFYGPEKPPATSSDQTSETQTIKASESIAVNEKQHYAFKIINNKVIAQTSLLVGKIILYEQPLFLDLQSSMDHEKDWTLLRSFIAYGQSRREKKRVSFAKTKDIIFREWKLDATEMTITVDGAKQQSKELHEDTKKAIEDTKKAIEDTKKAIEDQVKWELNVIHDQYPLVEGPMYRHQITQNLTTLYNQWCNGLRDRCIPVTDWLTNQSFGYGIYQYTSLLFDSTVNPNCMVLYEGNGMAYLVCLEKITSGQQLVACPIVPITFISSIAGLHLPTFSRQLNYNYCEKDQVNHLLQTNSKPRQVEIQWYILQKSNVTKKQWQDWMMVFQSIYYQYGWVWDKRLVRSRIVRQLSKIIENDCSVLQTIRWKLMRFCLVYELRINEIKQVIDRKETVWSAQSNHVCFQFLTEWASINPPLLENELTIWNRMIQPFPVSLSFHYFKLLNDPEQGILFFYKQLNRLLMSHDPVFVEDSDHPIRVERLFE